MWWASELGYFSPAEEPQSQQVTGETGVFLWLTWVFAGAKEMEKQLGKFVGWVKELWGKKQLLGALLGSITEIGLGY